MQIQIFDRKSGHDQGEAREAGSGDAGFITRHFPQFEFYWRIKGEFRLVKISPKVRASMVAALSLMIALLSYVVIAWLTADDRIAERDRRIEELSAAYEQLNQKLNENQEQFANSARELEDERQRLQDLAVRNGLMREGAAKPQRYDRAPNEATPAVPDILDRGEERAKPGRPEARNRPAADLNRHSAVELEKALRRTKLDLDGLVAQATDRLRLEDPVAGRKVARGGPFIPARGILAAFGSNSRSARNSGRGGDDALRLQSLLVLADRLPLDTPMAEGWITSDFGPRRDPITRQPAIHPGMDIGGPHLSSVFATAAGKVTFAGIEGAYGRLVELTHDFGIKTRYGHLSKIRVKEGELIPKGQSIGVMGSTGRSTGPHLHYEILRDDRPVDPYDFIEAGYYVLGQQKSSAVAH